MRKNKNTQAARDTQMGIFEHRSATSLCSRASPAACGEPLWNNKHN